MSSSTDRIPRLSVSMRPRLRLSGEDSDSGMKRATTRSLPRARAHSAATTLLSMPPDTPRTAPFRRKSLNTTSRIPATMRSTSLAGSMRKSSCAASASVDIF